MGLVGSSNEPVKEVGLFGYDGTLWRPVKIDASGNIQVEYATGQTIEVTQDTAADLLATVNIATGQTIEVTQDVAANLLATVNIATDQNVQARNYGYYSSSWQKQNLAWSYGGRIIERQLVNGAGASPTYVDTTAIASGRIAVIDRIFIYHTDATAQTLIVYITNGSYFYEIALTLSIAANVPYVIETPTRLISGDYLRAQWTQLVNPYAGVICIVGYYMDLDG